MVNCDHLIYFLMALMPFMCSSLLYAYTLARMSLMKFFLR